MSFGFEVKGHLTGEAEEAGPKETDILGRFQAAVEAVEAAYPGAITEAAFTGEHAGHVVLVEPVLPPRKGKAASGDA